MANGVVLDTSFLITLADSNRLNHKSARSYWKFFVEQGTPIFLPTIVVSEFYIKQEIPPEMLKACILLPFNWDDALTAAKLDFSKAARAGVSRDALKDDVKIIAQAIVKDAAWLITDDSASFYKFAMETKNSGGAPFMPIKLADGYDESLLKQSRQRDLTYDPASDDPEVES